MRSDLSDISDTEGWTEEGEEETVEGSVIPEGSVNSPGSVEEGSSSSRTDASVMVLEESKVHLQ